MAFKDYVADRIKKESTKSNATVNTTTSSPKQSFREYAANRVNNDYLQQEKERQDQRTRQAALRQLQNTLNTDISNRAGQIASGSPVSPMTTFPNKNMQAAYDQYKGAALKSTLDNIVAQNKQNRMLNPVEARRQDEIARKNTYTYRRDPDAKKYIQEGLDQGNLLSNRNKNITDSHPEWTKEYEKKDLADIANDFGEAVGDFVSGYKNPVKEQVRNSNKEVFRYMTPEQQQEYSYLLGKDSLQGTSKAKNYLDLVKGDIIEGEVQKRVDEYAKAEGVKRLAMDLGIPAITGLDDAIYGATDLFSNYVDKADVVRDPHIRNLAFQRMVQEAGKNDLKIRNIADESAILNAEANGMSPMEIAKASGNGSEGNALRAVNMTPEQILMQASYMSGNMAPSQAVGLVTGGLGAPAMAASAMGSAAMFPQVAGHAYNETLAQYGDVDKAHTYATLSGINEAIGEFALGGLEGVASGMLQDAITKTVPKALMATEGKAIVGNATRALAKVLQSPTTRFILNSAQEGAEEIIQGTIDSAIRNIVLNENNSLNPFTEENMQSALVAALSVAASNGPAMAINNTMRSNYGNEFIQNLNKRGYDYQKIADSINVDEADYTSATGTIDKPKLEQAKQTQELAQSLADRQAAGDTVSGLENAELADAIQENQRNISEHVRTKLSVRESKYADFDDTEIRDIIQGHRKMVKYISGGFDENGKQAFEALDSSEQVKKARPFTAYYNYGRFGIEVSEAMKNRAEEVGLTLEEQSKAMRAGAADANKLFPAVTEAQFKKVTQGIRSKGRTGTVTFQGVQENNLTTQQKLRVDFASSFLTKALGMDVVFVQSKVVNGEYKGINGNYNKVNGRPTITLDVNAGMNKVTDWTGEMSDIQTFLPTISHELTHFLEESNPEMYQQIATSVVSALQKNGTFSKGLSFNEVLNAERTRQDEWYRKTFNRERQFTNADAMHEIVARACEDMLSGNKAAMDAFKNMDSSTKRTIADHIKEIFDNIRDFFEQMIKGYSSTSSEAKAIRQNMQEFERIREMWNKALEGASEVVPASSVETVTAENRESENESYQSELSVRQFAQALDFDLELNSLGQPFRIIDPATGKAITHVSAKHMQQTAMGYLVQAAVENGSIDQDTADKQLKMFADLMNLTLKYDESSLPMIWEIAGSFLFSSVKTNADAQYATTVDYGTICSKTQALIDVLSKTMVKKGRGLTREEVIKAYNETAKTGLSVPCPVCYVFSRWMGVPSLLETMRSCQERFGNASEAEVQAYIKKMVKEYGDAKAINSEKTKVQNRMATLERKLQETIANKDEAGQKKIQKETQELQKKLDDLESFNWVTQVRCKSDGKNGYKLDPSYKSVPNDILLDLTRSGDFASKYPKSWKYRTTRGAGMGKAIMPYSGASIGDFIKGNKDRYTAAKNPFTTKNAKAAKQAVNRAITRANGQNLIGGQRFQSTSDYRAEWGIDYLMTFLECQAASSQVQLYTKVIEAVDFFASAGAECNLSIMPKDNGYVTLKNGKKKLIFSDVTGINFDEAYKKVQKYDNVQMILVGINDEHIRLALADDRISFVIPWHSSGNSKDTLAQLMNAVGENLDVTENVDYSDFQTDKVIDNSAEKQRLRQFRKEILQGKLWENYGKRVAKALTAEERRLLDSNSYLQDLYNRFYVNESAQEYGVRLNGKQVSSIFPYEYWDKSLTVKDADRNGDRFKEYCASLGIQPRFVEKFGNDPGYWKLLIDRKMYNNDGTYHAPAAIDVTNVNVQKQMPMAVNSNNYKDMSKINQATFDTLRALDNVQNDLEAVDVEGDILDNELPSDGQFSLRAFADGRRFVEIDQNQGLFDNAPEEQWPDIAKRIITSKFVGKVIGIDNRSFMNGKHRDEYIYPAKRLDDNERDAKLKASAEIDNLVDAVSRFTNTPDGEGGHYHKEIVDGFDSGKTLFKIGNLYFEGMVKIGNVEKGKIFWDVTKIKDVTQDIMSSYGQNPKSQFLRTSSMNNISSNAENGNTETASESDNPAYTGKYPGDGEFQHRVTEDEMLPDGSERVLDFLNQQIDSGEYTTVYKALLKIGNKFYPPMASLEKDENGKYTKLRGGQEKGDWIASDGILTDEMISKMVMKSPTAWKKQYAGALSDGRNPWGMYGNFTLKKSDANGKAVGDVGAAYNPYQHSSDQVLNDQFEAAYSRPDLVVVECRIPNSELDDPYWAPYAKDPTGMHEWKSGPIAGQLRNTTRHVYMTRWIQPVRVLEPAEVASRIYDVISKEDNQPRMYWNTLHPEVMTELEKLGVEIDPYGSPMHIAKDGSKDRYGNVIPANVKERIQNEREREKGQKKKKPKKATNSEGQPMFSQRNVDLDQRLADLVESYGALPKGENAKVDISIPAQTSENKRVRRYVRTVLESGITTDMMDDEIKESIVKEALSYEPVTDASAAEYAASVIKIGGTERAQKEWDKARSGVQITKHDMAVGQELLREYAKQGDVENVVKMVTELAAEGTRAGQSIQAMRMLKKYAMQSPPIGLGYIQKTVDQMNRDAKAKMGKKYKPMVINQKLAAKYINATTRDQIDAALGEIYKDLGSQVQKTTGEEIVDRLRSWRYLSMLGNPRTHVRNLVGNALFVPAVTMKNVIGATLEKATGSNRTKSITVSKEAKAFAAQDAAEMQDTLQGNADKSIKDLILEQRKTYKTPALNYLTKANGDALETEDWVFLRYHYQNALAQYITSNKLDVNNLEGTELAAARKYAVNEAQKATYRDANRLSTWLNQAGTAGAAVKYMMEGMVPFKKTPTNILRRGVEYSPAMLVERMTKGVYDLHHGKITMNEWIDGLASGLTGTAIFGIGMFLASVGAVIGGYQDDDDKEEKKLKGLQEYSVRIGNKTYTIDWAAPSSLPLFVGVETMYALREDGDLNFTDISKAAGRLIDPMINMSMLEGLNNTLDAITYADDKLSAFVMETFYNLLGQFVPTLFGQVARTMDTTQRINYQDANTGLSKNMLYFIEKMQNKIPYLTFSNDPYLNEFGQENVTESRWIAALQNFVSPGYISTVKDDRVINEVSRLQAEQEENVLPKKMPKYLGTKEDRVDLTSAQYTQFQRTAGTISYNIIDNMIDDKRYDKLTADEQAATIKMAYEYAKAVGRLELQPDYELKGDAKKIYNAVQDGKQAYDAILTLSTVEQVTGSVEADVDKKTGKTVSGSKKYNTIDEILKQDMSKEEKGEIFQNAYPSEQLSSWTGKGKSAYDFMMGVKLQDEISDKDIESDDKYSYVVKASGYTNEQKVAWFLSDKNRTESKSYTGWKSTGGTDWDYIKSRSDLSKFKGKGKQDKVVAYIKKQTTNEKKRRALWAMAGYKENTYNKNMK